MKDLLPHVGYFLVLSLAIVLLGAFYSEPDDRRALRSIPRRALVFIGSCVAVAAVMLVLEAVFTSIH